MDESSHIGAVISSHAVATVPGAILAREQLVGSNGMLSCCRLPQQTILTSLLSSFACFSQSVSLCVANCRSATNCLPQSLRHLIASLPLLPLWVPPTSVSNCCHRWVPACHFTLPLHFHHSIPVLAATYLFWSLVDVVSTPPMDDAVWHKSWNETRIEKRISQRRRNQVMEERVKDNASNSSLLVEEIRKNVSPPPFQLNWWMNNWMAVS